MAAALRPVRPGTGRAADAAGAGADAAAQPRLSIKREFAGATVLLTGATGYVGGLVLESMLRTTDVARVYVLLRAKKGQPAQARADKLLQGPVFHLVRDKPELLAKVTAVAGDLSEPALGLSAADVETLAGGVDILIHSAADIRLEAPIQETMRANYVGTRRVLKLALQLRRLRSMVHVSTCYVNINKPSGATVHERIYPLNHGEVEADGESVAQVRISLLPACRAVICCVLCVCCASACAVCRLCVPALLSSCACAVPRQALPHTLPVSDFLSQETEQNTRPPLSTQHYHQTNKQELLALPKAEADGRADFYTRHWGFPNTYCLGKHLAEQLVYRTQQATGLPVAILRPSLVTGVAGLPYPGLVGNWAGPSGMGAAMMIGFFPALSAHAVEPYTVWDAVPGDLVVGAILATAAAVAAGLQREIAAATGCGARASELGAPAATGAPSTLQSASATGSPTKRYGGASAAEPSDDPDGGASRIGAGAAAESPEFAASPLSGASADDGAFARGSPRRTTRRAAAAAAAAVAANGGVVAARASGAADGAAAGAPPMLIVHAATGTTYPAVVYETYNTAVDWLKAHGAKNTLLVGGARGLSYMPPTWRPNLRMIPFWRFYNYVKVALVYYLLRLFGLQRAAQKLWVGFQQWAMNNDPKNDTNLLFASAALQQLHARLEPEERADYLLTFGPPRAPGARPAAEGPEHPAAHLGWRQYSINCLAGITRMLTGVMPPQEAPIPGRPGEVIRHDYLHIR